MIDLHCHSTFSDGSLTPEELLQEAARIRLTALALTDHDTVAGLPRFLAAARELPLRAIPGVELSVDCAHGTMHMLAYWMDFDNPELVRQLEWIRDGRQARNRAMLAKLNALGLRVEWEEVQAVAGEDIVGRPHFAQVLVQKGFVRDKNEAFDRWLGEGKPAYADRARLTAEAAINLIRQAGGVAVLAHPSSLNISRQEIRALFQHLAAAGLAGVECYYPEHTPEQTRDYLDWAQQANLVPAGGSDFHGEIAPGIRLGVGFGQLNVPDEILAELEARRP